MRVTEVQMYPNGHSLGFLYNIHDNISLNIVLRDEKGYFWILEKLQ